MRKLFGAILVCSLFFSCKKEDHTPSFIINIDGNKRSFVVYPSDPTTAIHGVSVINYIPPQPVSLPAYYYIELHLDGGNGDNELRLSLPELQMQNTSYDSTYFFNVFNELTVDGVAYRSSGVFINNVSISLKHHSWLYEPLNSIASGSIDMSLDAVSTYDSAGNILRGNNLGKKIYIKGSFKNIFANQ